VTGGMQSWADALAANFRDLGGDLKLNAAVEKIRTQNGTAVGVVGQGKNHDADYVISACDYKKTFLNLLDNPSLLTAPVREKIEKAAVSEGVFTVYLGLKISNDQLRKYIKVPHMSFHDERPGADIQNSRDEKFFEKTSLLLYSPSLHDPDLAPTGKSSLMIQTTSPLRWLDNWGRGDQERYRSLKEQVKKTLIAKAEAVIPGLNAAIEFEDAATPLTYERYTGNTDGATSAWSWKPNKRFYKNVMSTKIDTPVRNLLIGSCWSGQIGGIPGAIAAAYACAKKIG
jgi:phytoene dehydrogenase-like protein